MLVQYSGLEPVTFFSFCLFFSVVFWFLACVPSGMKLEEKFRGAEQKCYIDLALL